MKSTHLLFLFIAFCFALTENAAAECDQWICFGNCLDVTYENYGDMIEQGCEAAVTECIVFSRAGFTEGAKVACGLALTCVGSPFLFCTGACLIPEVSNPCSYHPCLFDCNNLSTYGGWRYHCIGHDLWRTRYHTVMKCEHNNPGQPGECIIDGDMTGWLPHQDPEYCLNGCDPDTDECRDPVECRINSNCGEEHFIHSPECNNGDVYQDYWKPICRNPGSTSSYCDYETEYRLRQDCSAAACINGQCVEDPSCEQQYPGFPWECNGNCYGCLSDMSLCCPASGQALWCCYNNGPYCDSSTGTCSACGGDYPNECNGICYDCPDENSFICCPQDGESPKCCWNGGICNADGSCSYPSPEVCNNIDDDFDGVVDDFTIGCGTGACAGGTDYCSNGHWDGCTSWGNMSMEKCNNIDDDCDAQVDEYLTQQCGTDEGACSKGTSVCISGEWSECGGSYIGPAAEECNGIDDDCNGLVDDFNVCGDYPNVTLLSPHDGYISPTGNITFRCGVTDDAALGNISLHYSIGSTLHTLGTQQLSGTEATATFTLDDVPNGTEMAWNCYAYDADAHVSWAERYHLLDVTYGDVPFKARLQNPKGSEIFNDTLIVGWLPTISATGDAISYYLEYSNDSGNGWMELAYGYPHEAETKTATKAQTLKFSDNGSKEVSFDLPKNSAVTNLTLDIQGKGIFYIEDVDTPGDDGRFNSMALDSNDDPHISYSDYTDKDLKYAKWNGDSWRLQTVDSSNNVGSYTSIALDSNDYPHIAYYHETNQELMYANYDGSDWHKTVVDDAYTGPFPSLVLDSYNNPHIAYTASGSLKYAYYDGSWHNETLPEGGFYPSMALDSTNLPHISFSYFNGSSSSNLAYAHKEGDSWIVETVEIGGWIYRTSLVLDSYNNPHIVYEDHTIPWIKYAKFNGVSWEIENIGGVGRAPSLALDAAGNPYTTYYSGSSLRYAARNGTWSTETVDNPGYMNVHSTTSINIDSTGDPHISYYDRVNGDLKYTRLPKSYPISPTLDAANSGQPWEWFFNGTFAGVESSSLNTYTMNKWLVTCEPDEDFNCGVPITLTSSSPGIIDLTLTVEYSLMSLNWSTIDLPEGRDYRIRILATDGVLNSTFDSSLDFTILHGKDEDWDGYTNDQDCDDNNAMINPGAMEICDGKDNDCDNLTDEGDLCAGGICANGTCLYPNTPPAITSYAPANTTLKARVGYEVTFDHTSTDDDNDTLSYSWALDGNEQATTKSWTYTPERCAQHQVSLVVSDEQTNATVSWQLTTGLKGDVNWDGEVDIFDLSTVGLSFYKKAGEPGWIPSADVFPIFIPEGDGEVDIFDLSLVGVNFHRKCSDMASSQIFLPNLDSGPGRPLRQPTTYGVNKEEKYKGEAWLVPKLAP